MGDGKRTTPCNPVYCVVKIQLTKDLSAEAKAKTENNDKHWVRYFFENLRNLREKYLPQISLISADLFFVW